MLFITGNKNKLVEAQKIIPGLKSRAVDVEEIQSMNPSEVVLAKAKAVAAHVQEPFFVEDVSLDIASLKGLPGPFIKFFVAKLGPEGIAALAEGSQAVARASICYFDGSEYHVVHGEVPGTIVQPRGENKFGFDPFFQPEGKQLTYGQKKKKKKNTLSHRYAALQKLKELLQ